DEALVESFQAVEDVQRGQQGSPGIVLVRGRVAENEEQPVRGLRHLAFVAPYDAAAQFVAFGQDAGEVFGVEPTATFASAAERAGDHGDLAALGSERGSERRLRSGARARLRRRRGLRERGGDRFRVAQRGGKGP